ncbi:hypothetical protein MNBD_NITROSPINAE01-640 [hydrothermal vent metagenome]|uniref:Uncharacterized protein n=1 Tax=hydrothermal vent metagenome TaxID=652676 RepID=A0A3B1C7S8_9ZZZZ
MGELKDKFFLQYISAGLEKVRDGFREEHTPKKGNRFLIKGLTYEIGTCRKDGAQYVFEISSKIPQEVLPKNVKIEKYFSSVIKLMNKCAKKPSDSKMENIIHNTADEELKERDYVKLIYSYDENELCSNEDIGNRMKHHQENNTPVPDIPGVVTPGGRIVLALIREAIEKLARQNVLDLCAANEEVKKVMKDKAKNQPAVKKAAKKKTAKK